MIDAMQSWGQLSIPVRLVAAQAVVGSLLALIWGIGGGAHSGLAALTGAAIAVAGNGFFAARMFLRPRDDAAGMLRGFLAAEALKIALVLALLVIAMRWFATAYLPVIASFAATSLVFLWALRWGDPEHPKDQGA